jgi:hypothetical protein
MSAIAAMTVLSNVMLAFPDSFRGRYDVLRDVSYVSRTPIRTPVTFVDFHTFAKLRLSVAPTTTAIESFKLVFKHPRAHWQRAEDVAAYAPELGAIWDDMWAIARLDIESFFEVFEVICERPQLMEPAKRDWMHTVLQSSLNPKVIGLFGVLQSLWFKSPSAALFADEIKPIYDEAQDGFASVGCYADSEVSRKLLTKCEDADQHPPFEHVLELLQGNDLAHHLIFSGRCDELRPGEALRLFRGACLVLVMMQRGDLHTASMASLVARVHQDDVFDYDEWEGLILVEYDGVNVLNHACCVTLEYAGKAVPAEYGDLDLFE